MDLDIATAELESFSATPIKSVDFNISDLSIFEISENTEVRPLSDPVYEQFLADVWVGIVLTLMVLSCVCFMCSCLIYHKFQEWKHRVIEARNAANLEAGVPETDLPSYTIASGLPTYDEALEQLKKVKENQCSDTVFTNESFNTGENTEIKSHASRSPTSRDLGNTLSLTHLLQIYNKNTDNNLSKT